MTSYLPPEQIYERTLTQLIHEAPSAAECMSRVRALRAEAKRVDEETKRPGWTPRWDELPNHGVAETIQAITDFDTLRPLLTNDSFFRQFLLGRRLEM